MDTGGGRGSVSSMPDEDKKTAPQDAGMETLHTKTDKTIPAVDTTYFASVMGCIVTGNVICIGFETEMPESAALFGALNNGFLLLYIVELMMRMLTHGLKAFRDVYTVIDLMLVFGAILEKVVASGSVARALPSFRLLRLGRLLQTTRYFRHSKELRAIAVASVRMIKSLRWVVLFLFFFLWVMATFTYMIIGNSAEWNETMDPTRTFEPFVPLDIDEYFGSVVKSFLSLLQVLTLAQWSPHIARPIVKVYPVTFLFFIVFLFVTTYGMLVGVVANLVQDAMVASKQNTKALLEKQREERREIGMAVREILSEIDTDGSGELDVDEIDYALKVTDLKALLRDLGVPFTDPNQLVCLLDFNGNGNVSYDELVNGVVRMDEEITKRDYAMMGFWVKNLLNRTQHLEDRLGKLCDQISFIRKRLGGSFGALNHLIKTAQDTQLRQRAIHKIKTQGPELPPDLEKKVIAKPTLRRISPRTQLMGSLNRFLGEPPRPKRSYSPTLGDETLRTTALFNNTMADAPPRMEVGIRRAKREEMRHSDKYAVVLDNRRGPENPNLRALKRLVG